MNAKGRHPKPWHVAVFAALGIGSAVVLWTLLADAIEKVRSGHGLDTFRTAWLLEFNYVGVLVFVCVAILASVVAGLIAAVFRYRERRLWRELEKRYGTDAKRNA